MRGLADCQTGQHDAGVVLVDQVLGVYLMVPVGILVIVIKFIVLAPVAIEVVGVSLIPIEVPSLPWPRCIPGHICCSSSLVCYPHGSSIICLGAI